MVVQDDDSPAEACISKETKKFIIVKNHVRELLPEDIVTSSAMSRAQSPTNEEKESHKMKNKKLKRKKESKEILARESLPSEISHNDLEELKTVYKKCQAVLRKIESKYGHLLDLEDEGCSGTAKKSKMSSQESESDSCECVQKKKIVFDEEGQQIETVCKLQNHICPKNVERIQSKLPTVTTKNPAIHIEYDHYNKVKMNLPDSLQELDTILKDTSIDYIYRKAVIDKVFTTKQDHLFEIRQERKSLIEQLKQSPDELFDFKGTNMSSLPGYPKDILQLTEIKNSVHES